MALISRKISSFPQISSLSGEEMIMVAYKGKSYKMPISMLTGNAIQEISQRVSHGDGADNPITMKVGTGESATTMTFHVYNGERGSQGPDGKMGPKGPTGDTGIAIFDNDLSDFSDKYIYDSLLAEDMSEEELTQLGLSAKQGVELNNKLEALKEEFLTQVEYDDRVAHDEIDPTVKYFIWED